MSKPFQPTTATPDEVLPKPIWMHRIAKRGLDLTKVNPNSFLGFCILNSYENNPEQVLLELASQAADNGDLVREVIGDDNYKIII